MTTITYIHQHRRPAVRLPERASFITVLVERMTAAWNRRKTERMLESLPQEIRKDIGWPATIGR